MPETHNLICDFGEHKGKPWTRIPNSYLKGLVRSKAPHAHLAEAELARRGTELHDLDISYHAIDRASLDCLDIWRRTRDQDEGISSWLSRMAKAAMSEGKRVRRDRFAMGGMVLAFDFKGDWPVLVTVMRDTNQ